MNTTTLRLVDDESYRPLPHDVALVALNEHWKAARAAYADAIAAIGDHYLRRLIVPDASRGGNISRPHMAAIRDKARTLAQSASRMADELDRAVDVYGRVE